MGCGLLPSGGQLIEYGNIKVTKHGHGDGTGNGGCRHHQTMRQLAVVPTQRVTLFHTEAVLFIDHNHAKVAEGDRIRKQGVSTDHHVGGAVGDLGEYGTLVCTRH